MDCETAEQERSHCSIISTFKFDWNLQLLTFQAKSHLENSFMVKWDKDWIIWPQKKKHVWRSKDEACELFARKPLSVFFKVTVGWTNIFNHPVEDTCDTVEYFESLWGLCEQDILPEKKKKKERNYPTVVFGMCPWQPVASHPVCLNKKVFRSNLLIQAVSHE